MRRPPKSGSSDEPVRSKALRGAGSIVSLFGTLAALSIASVAGAQSTTPTATAPPPEVEAAAAAEEARPTGLPKNMDWVFNFDFGVGMFGFSNSLYANVRPDPVGDLSDNWSESFIKPALSMTYKTGDSELFGKISAVGERTFSAPPSEVVGKEAASFQVEDLNIGWRSGTSVGESENLIELIGGRAQYKIGHGMLLWDGGGEGGSRGGFWSNARKAWELAGIVRIKPGRNTFELFYLDRDDVPENDAKNKVWGGNYELSLGEGATTLGASYLEVNADPLLKPLRDGMSVVNVRAFTAPFSSLPGLSFEFEYAKEKNGELMSSEAWNGLVAYQFTELGWQPKFSYRYAYFGGDDPNTVRSENFDSLFTGFYDWGTWWQGEIAGEYFVSNSNLITNQFRVHVTPSDRLGMGLIGFTYQLDNPAALDPAVTSEDLMVEFDFYADWKLNTNFTLSIVAAYGNPRLAVEQAFGRTDDFTFGMLYLAYSY